MSERDDRKNVHIVLDDSSIIANRMELGTAILAALSDGLMLIDDQGRIVLANPAAGRILGIEMERFADQGWAELFFDEGQNIEFNQIMVTVTQKDIEQYHRQVPYTRPDGQLRQLAVTTIVMADHAKGGERDINAVLVVIADLTDLVDSHQREHELLSRSHRLAHEKAEGLDRLARAVAHEIRNPITSIGGLTRRLLVKVNPYSREAQYMNHILESVEKLETVVREVRDYADIRAPRLRPTNLVKWLHAQADAVAAEASMAGVRLVRHAPPPDEQAVMARTDSEMMDFIMAVLVKNSLEAMPSGGELRMGLGTDQFGAVITVGDNGRGIDPEDMPYLFDPFFSTKADAVGMSLAKAKRMALEQHGDLAATSNPGKGATFTMHLPLAEDEESAEAGQPGRAPSLR